AIIFDTEILFAYDDDALKEDSFTFLDEFVPKYLDVLLESEYEDYIADIIIEGHTDGDGYFLYNFELAQDMAYSVASFVMSDDFPYKNIQAELEEKLNVNNKHYTDLRNEKAEEYSE